jgi:hypothetical protein
MLQAAVDLVQPDRPLPGRKRGPGDLAVFLRQRQAGGQLPIICNLVMVRRAAAALRKLEYMDVRLPHDSLRHEVRLVGEPEREGA